MRINTSYMENETKKLRMTRSRISDNFHWKSLVAIQIKGKKISYMLGSYT